MAVLDGVEFTVTSGGRDLQEYDVGADEAAVIRENLSHPDSPHVVKYIEAIPGAEFQLKYTLKKNYSFGKANYTCFKTEIDGKKVSGPVITLQKYRRRGTFTTVRCGVYSPEGSQSKERPFYWKELLTTDEKPNATPAELKEKYSQLGTIQVKVLRAKGFAVGPASETQVAISDELVPEKALKGRAVDATMGLQSLRPTARVTKYDGDHIDECPRVVFIFQYRSRDALQRLGILPRTPEPLPLEARDPDSLTLDQARELLRRQMAEREAARAKIKKEKAAENLRQLAAIRVKREASATFVPEDEGISIVEAPVKKPRLRARSRRSVRLIYQSEEEKASHGERRAA
ncbi:hypothetical protein EDD36DRAFT_484329 [Exophiala viscosa]|uniref:DUF7918 domain-containing protein n=1 Tax=Exophiala viscosa TaxID=2486360 RepID=A0AAN6E3B1_9EURO|nr:hypothetical protein EDD36DRAFT_484329 [Exophiala viscosa]